MKNNDLKLTGLIIRKNGSNIAPTIYLEPFYEKYLCGSSMSDVLKEIAELRVESDPFENYDISEILDLEELQRSAERDRELAIERAVAKAKEELQEEILKIRDEKTRLEVHLELLRKSK